jgi:hypothetical protein
MTSESQKRQYHKPIVIRVELVADEVLAAGCKTNKGSTTGVIPPRCRNGGCFANGS